MSADITNLTLEKSQRCNLGTAISEDITTIPVIFQLCKALEAEEIEYCHWKSNAAILRSASGDNDLDLLVSRADAHRFVELLGRFGCVECQLLPEEQLPGIRDFYSFDAATNRLIHIHAHFQLILGNDLTKNYCLPIERSYLDSAIQRDLFRIPAPEFELIIFVIRMILKHSTWDAILMRHGSLSATEKNELEFLLTPINLDRSREVLEQHLPFIDYSLFESCIHVLQPACSFWKRIQAGSRLQNQLASCARRPLATDLLLKFWRRVEQPIVHRLNLKTPRRRMANGGLMVAVIGGDGSGKTTMVTELSRSFSKEFDVLKVHMGKPSWSWTTIIIRGVLKIGRSFGLYPFIKEGTEPGIDTNSPSFPGYPWLFREVCTARDRYLEYKQARRFATNGGLVICDRFPLPQIKIMDGPQVERVTARMKSNMLIKFLAAVENHYYQRIMSPDLLIVLRVDPEVCVQRKTDETADSVRSRSNEIWNVNWRETRAHVIDASRSKSQVIAEALYLVWSHL